MCADTNLPFFFNTVKDDATTWERPEHLPPGWEEEAKKREEEEQAAAAAAEEKDHADAAKAALKIKDPHLRDHKNWRMSMCADTNLPFFFNTVKDDATTWERPEHLPPGWEEEAKKRAEEEEAEAATAAAAAEEKAHADAAGRVGKV